MGLDCLPIKLGILAGSGQLASKRFDENGGVGEIRRAAIGT
jgi:hypothetical protein